MNLQGRDFLKLLDFSSEEIRYLLDLSRNFKDDDGIFYNLGIVYEKLKN